jgi:hypothetical protein
VAGPDVRSHGSSCDVSAWTPEERPPPCASESRAPLAQGRSSGYGIEIAGRRSTSSCINSEESIDRSAACSREPPVRSGSGGPFPAFSSSGCEILDSCEPERETRKVGVTLTSAQAQPSARLFRASESSVHTQHKRSSSSSPYPKLQPWRCSDQPERLGSLRSADRRDEVAEQGTTSI